MTDPFWIPRYQDFWDKSLGWFLGFQSKGFTESEQTVTLFIDCIIELLVNQDRAVLGIAVCL